MASASAPIRVGLIGYGYAGKTFHAPLIRAVPTLDLRVVASRDPAKVRSDLPGMAVVTDPAAVATSDGVDLVVIASPNDTHAPLARIALEAGKHVVVDKPFTLDLAEARGLVALARRHGRMLSVFHNRRWDSDYLTVRKAIAAGAIGKVRHFESHFDRFRPQVRDRWREGAGPGGGIWYDLGPHLVDQALQLFRLPDRMTANLARLRPGALADDWAHVVLDYPDLRVVLQASMLVAGGSPRFVVHGEAGSLIKERLDIQEQQLLAGMAPGASGWGADPDGLAIHDGTGHVERMPAVAGDQRRYYEGVARQLTRGAIESSAALEALQVMACIEAALISARTGTSVAPALTAEERDITRIAGYGAASPRA
ncbi:oxidoreductase [Methylobacterium pseudosasicola]|uniref:Predicted dehydrogenase n=1 Tax=Methylobacterium pseudosasicola TaxID=582667 RepID=A0A1I4IBY4_9HYPH|nr:oxidoreductase [Methylobacterium pseudosasicola]SFL51908.1 Predicted dehydrogenase [Methylobacterium pseudosasicola]